MPTITVTVTAADGTTTSIPVGFTVARPTLAPATLGDGSNRAADLQAWIASLPDGSTADLGGMSVRADQTVTITGKTGLTVTNALLWTDDPTGDGSTLASPSRAARTRAHWRLTGCTDVTMRGCSVRGPNTAGGTDSAAYVEALEAQHAFDVQGCTGIVVDGGEQSYIYGDCCYLGVTHVAGATVRNLHGHHNGRQGVAVTNATDVTIEGCDLHDIRHSHVDLEPASSSWAVDGVTIRANKFGAKRLTWIAAKGCGHVDNVLIDQNTVDAPGNIVMGSSDGTRRVNWTVSNNVAVGIYGSPTGHAFGFERLDGLTVVGNTIPLQAGRGMYLAGVTDCTAVDVHGNTYPGGVGELQPA